MIQKTFILILLCIFTILNVTHAVGQPNNYMRWDIHKMPLKIYIEENPQVQFFDKSYITSVTNALNSWLKVNQKDNKYFSYTLVKKPDFADMKILWVNELGHHDVKNINKLGHNWYWGTTNLGNPTTINIVTKHPLNHNQPNSSFDIYLIALHEIGHGLGVWWHSQDSHDAMFKNITISPINHQGYKIVSNDNVGQLTVRDISNFRKLYSIEDNNLTFLNQLNRHTILKNPLLDTITVETDFTNREIEAKYYEIAETVGIAGASLGKKANIPSLNIERVKQELAKNPNDFKIINDLGLAYLQNGLLEQALGTLQNGLSINPEYPPLYLNLGLVYQKLNNYQASIQALEKFVSYEPDNELSKKVIEQVQHMKNLHLQPQK